MKKIKYSEVEKCPLRRSLKVLGGKWNILIIYNLTEPKRYGELKRLILGISEKVLIDKLKVLEENNLIKKKNYNQIPPKVIYSLTKKGEEVLKIIPFLVKLGKKFK